MIKPQANARCGHYKSEANGYLGEGDLLHLGRVEKLHLQAAVHFLIGVVVIMLSIIYQFNKLNVGFVFLDA